MEIIRGGTGSIHSCSISATSALSFWSSWALIATATSRSSPGMRCFWCSRVASNHSSFSGSAFRSLPSIAIRSAVGALPRFIRLQAFNSGFNRMSSSWALVRVATRSIRGIGGAGIFSSVSLANQIFHRACRELSRSVAD